MYLLADKQKTELNFYYTDVFTEIQLTSTQPDPFVSVVVVEFSKKPEIEDNLVAKTADGGFSLLPHNQNYEDESLIVVPKARGGTIPAHVEIKKNRTFK